MFPLFVWLKSLGLWRSYFNALIPFNNTLLRLGETKVLIISRALKAVNKRKRIMNKCNVAESLALCCLRSRVQLQECNAWL